MAPRTKAADELHAIKYRGPGEDFEEAMNRVAFGLAGKDHRQYFALRDILIPQRFCPGGRIQGAIGATRETTAFNCYVSGIVEDSLVDGDGCIMDRLKEAAATSKLGGGIGYDFSRLRPRKSPVKRIETDATGPVSFMEFYNTVCLGIASSGHRRGAQMAILRVDHPDIEEFIRAKQKENALEGFNISVGVTDEFMEAVYADGLFWLQFGGQKVREIRAGDLYQKIMRATWDWAEPGMFFIDTVNRMNNLWYCETIEATNPCGEQPLPPFGACLLGSFNLTQYLVKTVSDDQKTLGMNYYYFDFDQLKADIPIIVRGMDRVTDVSRYPIHQQAEEAKSKRRMGLGIMGLANAGEALGYFYGDPGFLAFEAEVLKTIRDESYRASALLAKEKGAFPLFDKEKYLEGQFIKTLPEDIQRLIADHGIRNSHLTSIAPTGTIALCADNVSSGIEPVFSHSVQRKINTPNGPTEVTVEDYGVAFLSTTGKASDDVTAAEHVSVLLTAQKYVDSAVSKTVNMTGDMPWDDFVSIYSTVHKGGGKGCTTFNKDGKKTALLAAGKPGAAEDGSLSCEISPDGRRSCE